MRPVIGPPSVVVVIGVGVVVVVVVGGGGGGGGGSFVLPRLWRCRIRLLQDAVSASSLAWKVCRPRLHIC